MGNSSIQELADKFCSALSSGELGWESCTIAPGYAKGALNEMFLERLRNEGDDFLQELAGWGDRPNGWTEDRLQQFSEGLDAPTSQELRAWAEFGEIDPDWLLIAPMTIGSQVVGYAIFIQAEAYRDDGRYEVVATFPREREELDYIKENWPD